MITQNRLKEVLKYNPDTGVFTWRGSAGPAAAGAEAGSPHLKGYIQIGIDGKLYKAHRLAVLYTDGYMPENTVDHIDRVPSHNWRLNLREATQQCQTRNCCVNKNNTSGIKGISWYKAAGKWRADIMVDRRQKHLGLFGNPFEAACARYAAEQCLGFQDCDVSSSARKYIKEHGGIV